MTRSGDRGGSGPARSGGGEADPAKLSADHSRADRRSSRSAPRRRTIELGLQRRLRGSHRRMAAAAGRIGRRGGDRHRLEQSLAVGPGRRDRSGDSRWNPGSGRSGPRRRRMPALISPRFHSDSTTFDVASPVARLPCGSGSSRRSRSGGGATEAEEIFIGAADRGAEGAAFDRRELRRDRRRHVPVAEGDRGARCGGSRDRRLARDRRWPSRWSTSTGGSAGTPKPRCRSIGRRSPRICAVQASRRSPVRGVASTLVGTTRSDVTREDLERRPFFVEESESIDYSRVSAGSGHRGFHRTRTGVRSKDLHGSIGMREIDRASGDGSGRSRGGARAATGDCRSTWRCRRGSGR